MQVTADEAEKHFEYYCDQAKADPVIVEIDGRPDTVMMDFEAFQALRQQAGPICPADPPAG
ncbi:type II toxin-antitoxin system Phd/YefM family antitoxin [Ramlibacter rhizophilus]|uniref:Type II toxin-antitoxin system Phd/YefM family antitoxin n=1 Tax=Ramlibacter rhizophilus TaxID=1781167 RepID=A0A4Z0BRU1_9BURK|nr:type II toxin-antitoxin system Phd/YefM family antitoxin [Ramlibacter rhizophilus]TFZ01462.1 type II toxin-antitoxin system Phd/YefM family antitoxin [Ramlibacter rhizophilus]